MNTYTAYSITLYTEALCYICDPKAVLVNSTGNIPYSSVFTSCKVGITVQKGTMKPIYSGPRTQIISIVTERYLHMNISLRALCL
jgi:hypothetical protein